MTAKWGKANTTQWQRHSGQRGRGPARTTTPDAPAETEELPPWMATYTSVSDTLRPPSQGLLFLYHQHHYFLFFQLTFNTFHFALLTKRSCKEHNEFPHPFSYPFPLHKYNRQGQEINTGTVLPNYRFLETHQSFHKWSLPVLGSHQDPTLHLLTLSSKSSPIFNISSIYVFYTQDSPLMWVFLILSHEQSRWCKSESIKF